MLPCASQPHVLDLQVTATLSAAALKATCPGKDKQGDKADPVLVSLKRVLDVNGKDDFPVSFTLSSEIVKSDPMQCLQLL